MSSKNLLDHLQEAFEKVAHERSKNCMTQPDLSKKKNGNYSCPHIYAAFEGFKDGFTAGYNEALDDTVNLIGIVKSGGENG